MNINWKTLLPLSTALVIGLPLFVHAAEIKRTPGPIALPPAGPTLNGLQAPSNELKSSEPGNFQVLGKGHCQFTIDTGAGPTNKEADLPTTIPLSFLVNSYDVGVVFKVTARGINGCIGTATANVVVGNGQGPNAGTVDKQVVKLTTGTPGVAVAPGTAAPGGVTPGSVGATHVPGRPPLPIPQLTFAKFSKSEALPNETLTVQFGGVNLVNTNLWRKPYSFCEATMTWSQNWSPQKFTQELIVAAYGVWLPTMTGEAAKTIQAPNIPGTYSVSFQAHNSTMEFSDGSHETYPCTSSGPITATLVVKNP